MASYWPAEGSPGKVKALFGSATLGAISGGVNTLSGTWENKKNGLVIPDNIT